MPIPLVLNHLNEGLHPYAANQRLGARIIDQPFVAGHSPSPRAECRGHSDAGGGIPRVAISACHRRRKASPTLARQPSSNTAVTDDATTTKLAATPAELALRNSMPTATVQIQTTTPVGTTAMGRRQPRDASQPTTVPVRNGHAVDATPVTLRPSAWLRRPTVQNTSTPTTSVASHASHTGTRPCMQRDYAILDPVAAANLDS
jgi:hypothetical protein